MQTEKSDSRTPVKSTGHGKNQIPASGAHSGRVIQGLRLPGSMATSQAGLTGKQRSSFDAATRNLGHIASIVLFDYSTASVADCL